MVTEVIEYYFQVPIVWEEISAEIRERPVCRDALFSPFSKLYQVQFFIVSVIKPEFLHIHEYNLPSQISDWIYRNCGYVSLRLAREAGLEYIEIQNLTEFYDDHRFLHFTFNSQFSLTDVKITNLCSFEPRLIMFLFWLPQKEHNLQECSWIVVQTFWIPGGDFFLDHMMC